MIYRGYYRAPYCVGAYGPGYLGGAYGLYGGGYPYGYGYGLYGCGGYGYGYGYGLGYRW